MTDITIPKEAIEAGRRAFANAGTADDDRDPFAEACLAMLRAWPGVRVSWLFPPDVLHVVLPLTENANAEA